MPGQWNHKVFNLKEESFEAMALEIFRFQYENNPVYRGYADALNRQPGLVDSLEKIPFLPISFYKSQEVKTGLFEPEAVFESSGTTSTTPSRHFVKDLALYQESFLKGFARFYGPVNEWCILGLLPSYLERKHSSLVYMTEKLIHESEHPQSGFYLNEFEKLLAVLRELEKRKQKILLIGVSFALLDFAEKYALPLQHTVIMETGGMKGRREEMVRDEVHAILKKSFSLDRIHSEYGMTELLSQAYSKGNGIFHSPPWMKVLIRDEEDPFLVRSKVQSSEFGVHSSASLAAGGRSIKRGSAPDSELRTMNYELQTIAGAINIIDLANIHSCSFIATDDVGKLNMNGSFEVLGRMDGSDLRGCGLMVV